MNELAPGVGDSFVDDFNNGGFHFGELMTPSGATGAADAGTILIDSRYNDGDPKNDLATCADIALHEYLHWQNAQGSSTGEDETTKDPLCGGCNHADMHMTMLIIYLERACEDNMTSAIDYCELAENNLYAAGEHMTSCSPSCPGYGASDSNLVGLEEDFEECCE